MVMTPRVHGLNVGVTDIHRWRQQDDVHLPESRFRPAPFLPQPQALDAILRRETLDERLARHVVPTTVDPDLLAPAVMSATRVALRDRMVAAATRARGRQAAVLARAAELLADEVALDDDVQRALAALLRG
jgi:hypothetical protein